MEFDVLVKRLVPEGSELRRLIEALLLRKKAGEELDYEPKLNVVNDYFEESLARLEQSAAQMPPTTTNIDDKLDELFRSSLRDVWK